MKYPSEKRNNDVAKLFMNQAVKTIVKNKHIKPTLATVLDDHYLQSTNTCKAFKKVVITQNDPDTYLHISKHPNLHKNTLCLHLEYSKLPHDGITLDHADFCTTWESNCEAIFERLKNRQYAEKSILRLTVCGRGMTNKYGNRKGMTMEKCVDKIELDMQSHSYGYKIRPLKLREWGMPLKKNGFDPSDGDSIAYTYGTMINMIFLITT